MPDLENLTRISREMAARLGEADLTQSRAAWAFMKSGVTAQRDRPVPSGTFQENYDRAVKELRETGTTTERSLGRSPLAEMIYRRITPFGYTPLGASLDRAGPGENVRDLRTPLEKEYPARFDAWAWYLGLPQKHDTFEVSPYAPSRNTQDNMVYYRIKNFWRNLLENESQRPASQVTVFDLKKFMDKHSRPSSVTTKGSPGPYTISPGHAFDNQASVMGVYKLGESGTGGVPYVSYYDRWDLDRDAVEGSRGRFGRPFELYDRLYYNPEANRIYWDGLPADRSAPPSVR